MKKLFITSALASTLLLLPSCKDTNDDIKVNIPNVENLSAVETVNTAQNALMKGSVTHLWALMPSSYQDTVTNLIHESAKSTDPEIQKLSAELVKELTTFLTSKEDMILELVEKQINNPKEFAKVKQYYSPVVNLLHSLATSDLNSTEKLKSLDIAATLQEIEPQIQEIVALVEKTEGKNFDEYKVKATAVSENDTTSVVNIQEADKDTGKNEEFTKVDGKWVPSDIANEFDQKMAEALETIKAQGTMPAEQKAQVLMMMNMAKGIISSLNQAQSAEELETKFKTEIEPMIGPMLGPMLGGRCG